MTGTRAQDDREERREDRWYLDPAPRRSRGGGPPLASRPPSGDPEQALRRQALRGAFELGLRRACGFTLLGRRRIEQAAAMGAGAQRLAVTDRGVQLRREAQIAAAAVRLADLDDGGTAAHPPEGIVRDEKSLRNGVAQRGPTLFEGPDELGCQRRVSSQLRIGRGEVLQGTNGLIHSSPMCGPGLRLAPTCVLPRRRPGRSNPRRARRGWLERPPRARTSATACAARAGRAPRTSSRVRRKDASVCRPARRSPRLRATGREP